MKKYKMSEKCTPEFLRTLDKDQLIEMLYALWEEWKAAPIGVPLPFLLKGGLFHTIMECESEYLIVNGGMCTGKFYMACKKVLLKCFEKPIIAIIVAHDTRYVCNMLSFILKGKDYKINKSQLCLSFKGSKIFIKRPGNVKIARCDYAIIKGAGSFKESVFDELRNRVDKQIILTSTPPPRYTKDENGIVKGHWLRRLDKSPCSERIDIALNNNFR